MKKQPPTAEQNSQTVTLMQLRDEFWPDAAIVEEEAEPEIRQALDCKSACYWGNGGQYGGWTHLATYSPANKNTTRYVVVCRDENVPEDLRHLTRPI